MERDSRPRWALLVLGIIILLSLVYLFAWWSIKDRKYFFWCGLTGHLCTWLVGLTMYRALRTDSPELRGFLCFAAGLVSFVANFFFIFQVVDLSPEDQRREGFKILPLGLLMFGFSISSGFLLSTSKKWWARALGFLLLVGIGLVMVADLPRLMRHS